VSEIPRNPGTPQGRKSEGNVARFPWKWKQMSWDPVEMVKIVWDYGEIVDKLTYGAPQLPKQPKMNPSATYYKCKNFAAFYSSGQYFVTR